MSTTEEEAPITATEPPTTRDSWWRRKKRVWIGAVALAILILIITISVSARPKSVWNELTVASSSLDARFAKLTGTWDDRLIVMGYTNEGSTFVESYKRTDNEQNTTHPIHQSQLCCQESRLCESNPLLKSQYIQKWVRTHDCEVEQRHKQPFWTFVLFLPTPVQKRGPLSQKQSHNHAMFS